jgi:hypothetical protein
MVVDIDAVVHPIAASLGIGAFYNKLIQHMFDNLGHGAEVFVRLHVQATDGTCLAGIGLGSPCMIEAVAAEVVLAGQLDGLVEGGMAYEAHEVAVRRRHVFERGEFGRDLDNSAAAALRRG